MNECQIKKKQMFSQDHQFSQFSFSDHKMQSENQPFVMSDNPSCSKEVEVYEKTEIAVRQLELSPQAITISIDADGFSTWIEALKIMDNTKAIGNVLYHMGLIRRFASLFQWN